jgi:hypothetical protein
MEIGSMHGDVAVSAAGEVYISVEGSVRQRFAILGPNPGLQVYAPDGRFLRNVPGAPPDLHGFIIHRDSGVEYLYGVRLAAGPSPADQTRAGLDGQVVVKMTLDGAMAMTIPASRIPDQFKNKAPDGQSFMRLTGIAVAPNGDLYVTDGYASDYVHRFDRNGRYLASFGGKQPPYGFRTLHKLAIDTRFEPVRLIACDRENGRVVHLSLDGQLLGVVAADLRRPAAVAIQGEYAAIGELRGRVTLLDKAGHAAGVLGENTVADEIASNRTEPSKWRPGIVTAPHGVAFNARCDYKRRSIELNTDPILTRPGLKHLAVHEGYPGHYVQFKLRETMVRSGEAPADVLLSVVNTASSSVFEGIGDAGVLMLDWLEGDDDRFQAVMNRYRAGIGTGAAWRLHALGWTAERTADWLREKSLAGGEGWVSNRIKFFGAAARAVLIWSYWWGEPTVSGAWSAVAKARRPEFLRYLHGRMHSNATVGMFA